MMYELSNILSEMKSDKVSNYVIAGLNSYLLENGKVRLFENERDHQDSITPHSHRFDFVCMVLEGYVHNTIWHVVTEHAGDLFEESVLTYKDEIGKHDIKKEGQNYYKSTTTAYHQGQMYTMDSSEIHSIKFGRGAKVLFFEGPTKTSESKILEPVVNGEKIPTFEVRDYMFQKEIKS